VRLPRDAFYNAVYGKKRQQMEMVYAFCACSKVPARVCARATRYMRAGLRFANAALQSAGMLVVAKCFAGAAVAVYGNTGLYGSGWLLCSRKLCTLLTFTSTLCLACSASGVIASKFRNTSRSLMTVQLPEIASPAPSLPPHYATVLGQMHVKHGT
jgi:hypothetical protein